MSETTNGLVVMAGAVILPLLPAFLLFRFLPSTSDVSGPFKGMQIRLGGAFSAYFLVFVSLVAIRPRDTAHYHTWVVTGTLAFDHAPTEAEPNINDVTVRAVPPRLAVMNQGRFSWEIPVPDDAAGAPQFPDLQVDLRGYAGLTVQIGDGGYGGVEAPAMIDRTARTVVFPKPVRMASERALTPAGPVGFAMVAGQP